MLRRFTCVLLAGGRPLSFATGGVVSGRFGMVLSRRRESDMVEKGGLHNLLGFKRSDY